MTDDNHWHHVAQYYDGRANEYDELYEGKGPAFPDPEAYKDDVKRIREIAHDFGRGHLIDIACGTGFWLPYYASNCAEITLVDQSERCWKWHGEEPLTTLCWIDADSFEAITLMRL